MPRRRRRLKRRPRPDHRHRWAARDSTEPPVAAYNVSGEYAIREAAAARGRSDEAPVMMVTPAGIRHADVEPLVTHHAKEAARWLRQA